jgi:dephospho-CoA kinase
MIKVGITGCIGSGKTTVCRVFEHLGVPVYYSDYEAKKHYEHQDVKDKLYTVFGKEIFTETNDVDKKQLARIVFNDVALLGQLNKIIHPLVEKHFETWCKEYENRFYTLFESALLYSCKLTHLFDKIIYVESPVSLVVDRVTKRDNILPDDVKRKLNTQLQVNDDNITPDYVIMNDEKQLIIPQIIEIHQDLSDKK